MAWWLGCWIPSPVVPGSKPVGGSKFALAFHPSKIDEMSVMNSQGLNGKQ